MILTGKLRAERQGTGSHLSLCCGSQCGWPLWLSCTIRQLPRDWQSAKSQTPWSRLPRARGICHATEPGLFTGVRPLPSKLFWIFWPGIPLFALSFTSCICLSLYLSLSPEHRKWWHYQSHLSPSVAAPHAVAFLKHMFSLTLISEETRDQIRKC